MEVNATPPSAPESAPPPEGAPPSAPPPDGAPPSAPPPDGAGPAAGGPAAGRSATTGIAMPASAPAAASSRVDGFPLAATAYVAGLVLVFLGERVIPTITWVKWGLTGLGVVAVIVSAALRASDLGRFRGERRTVEVGLLTLTLVGLVALVVQFAGTDEGERFFRLMSMPLQKRMKVEAITTCLWLGLLASATVPLLFAERALYPMRRSDHIEGRRVIAAGTAGLALALAATYATLVTYAVGQFDVKADFSYFRTARPSDSSRKMLASSTDEIKIQSFFPDLNDVGVEVNRYLRDLTSGIVKAKVETYDRLLVPSIAKDARVTKDGVVVLKRGTQIEQLVIGADMSTARSKLKTLDTDFQKTLLRVLRKPKTAYLTVGHGELNEGTRGRSTRGIRHILESQGYSIKELGLAEGLGNRIPDDATAVLMLGPAQPLLPGEMDTLRKYIARGGHMLLALDPDAKIDLDPLADLAQLTVKKGVLANDRVFVRIRYNDSDHAALLTNRFSSHASVSTLSRDARAAVIFYGAAGLDRKTGADASYHIDFTVHALRGTFLDENENFAYDPGESKVTYHLAAAISKPMPETVAAADKKDKESQSKAANETRLFVVGDSDVFSDMFLENGPNVVFFLDALRWLGGEESFAGEITSTEDVKIEHTRQKDLVWFYSTIVGVPALVLGLGLVVSRKRKPARAGGGASASASGGAQ